MPDARIVDITRLKRHVANELPSTWVLRDIILSEPDRLTPSDLSSKSEVWLKLLRRVGDERS